MPRRRRTDLIPSLFVTRENLMAETTALRRGELHWPRDFDLKRGEFRTWSPEISRTEEQRAQRREADLDKVKSWVWEIAGCPWGQVLEQRRGRTGNPARVFTVWLLAKTAGFSYGDIGQTLDMTAAHVAVTLNRLQRLAPDSPVHAWIQQHEERINMSPDGVG